ncbi:Uma2 family endonuclease [soil metagenome]
MSSMDTRNLKLRFRPGLRLTDEAFWRLCRANPELDLERSAEGDLIIVAPAGADSDHRNAGVVARLWYWNEANGEPGVVFGPSAGFTLPNTAIRGPDAAWISRDRWEATPEADRKRFVHLCPEFVVEVRSPSDELNVLRKKMREYIAQGTRLGWMIDPKTQTVEIYRPDPPVERLKRPDMLSGEDVLPGFELELKGILYD